MLIVVLFKLVLLSVHVLWKLRNVGVKVLARHILVFLYGLSMSHMFIDVLGNVEMFSRIACALHIL